MKIKRLSLRFNLENEIDRKAWEHLQTVTDSKNKAIISAINSYFGYTRNNPRLFKGCSYSTDYG